MAQDKILQTRISLKYDNYANWHSKNPTLLEGEVAVVVVPNSDPVGNITNVPTVLFKVGDGAKKFDELPWVSGPAGDVYAWAKAPNKPSYKANEISGLSDFISGQIQDTDTQYRIAISGRTVQLFKKNKDDGAFGTTPDSTFNLPDETLHTLVEGTTNGTVKYDGKDVKVHGLGSAAYEDSTFLDANIADAKKAGTDAQTAVNALSSKVGTVSEGKTVIGLIDEAKKAGTDAQASVEALDTRVGVIPSGSTATTVIQYVDKKIEAIPEQTDYSLTVTNPTSSTYAQVYEFKQLGKTIGTINIPKDMVVQSGTVETKAEAGEPWGEAGTYLHLVLANAENSSIYINVGDLIEYVSAGSGENDAIQISISADHKVSASVKNGSITLAMLASGVQAEINKAHTHANKTELDKIADGDKAKWDAMQGNAETYTNNKIAEEIEALDGSAIATAEADGKISVLTGVEEINGVISKKSEATLEKIAKTGNVADLMQTSGNYIIFNCGSATENI